MPKKKVTAWIENHGPSFQLVNFDEDDKTARCGVASGICEVPIAAAEHLLARKDKRFVKAKAPASTERHVEPSDPAPPLDPQAPDDGPGAKPKAAPRGK